MEYLKMSFFHFDTTIASSELGLINLEDLSCDADGRFGAVVTVGFLSFGQTWCFSSNFGDSFVHNWADPNDITPGSPLFQMKRNAGTGNVTPSGPAAEVWTNATSFVGFGWSVANGGSGYVVNDTIEWVGGTHETPVQATVSSVSSGAITDLTFTDTGDYGILPTDPIASITLSGSGVNATFNANSSFDHRVAWTIGAGYGFQSDAQFTVSVRKGTGAVIDTALVSLEADAS